MLGRYPRLFRALALLLLVGLAACGGAGPREGRVVLAGASLEEALGGASRAWTAEGDQPPVLSFAATSALARQVGRGAPADVLISADEEWIDRLEEQDLLREGSRQDL